MTSLLRKSLPTTRPNTVRTKRTDAGLKNCKWQILFATGALTLTVALAASPTLANGWRAVRGAKTRSVSPVNPLRVDNHLRQAAWDDQSAPPMPSADQDFPTPQQGVRVAQENDPFERFFDEPAPPDAIERPQHDSSDRDPFEEEIEDKLPEDQSIEDVFDEPQPEVETEPKLPSQLPAESLPEPSSESAQQDAAPAMQDLDEAQEAVDRELQRRESADRVDEELLLESPFGDDEAPEVSDDPEQAALDKLLELLQRGDPNLDSLQDELSEEERRRRADARRRQELAQERATSEKSCRDEFQSLRDNRIDTVDLSIRVDGEPGEDYPYECGLGDELFASRSWPEITYMWKASGLCHKPLYFEQVQLERYGHSWGPYLQPIMSGAHFFVTLPVLPYKMGIRTPTECVYTLGYYRPGSCAPYMIDPVPFTWRAAAFEAGAWTAGAFVLP